MLLCAGTVDECSLVKPAANTHEVEQSSRVVILQTLSGGGKQGSIQLRVPTAPEIIMPGPHMLFCMLQRDVYSPSVWVTLK